MRCRREVAVLLVEVLEVAQTPAGEVVDRECSTVVERAPTNSAPGKQRGCQTELVNGTVTHLHRSGSHTFSKQEEDALVWSRGMGVEGDADFGATVKHRSRVKADPQLRTQPAPGPSHAPRAPRRAPRSRASRSARATSARTSPPWASTSCRCPPARCCGSAITRSSAPTGLRNPCVQIEGFHDGLLEQVLGRDADGNVVRRAGVMSVVVLGGTVRKGDPIDAALCPHRTFPSIACSRRNDPRGASSLRPAASAR